MSEELTRLSGWGMIASSDCRLERPQTVDQIVQAVTAAAETGRSVIARGSGMSYGDAALNRGNTVLDLTGLNRVSAWDADTGVVEMEPGVTVGQLCRLVRGHGWWPPVVPGTQSPTLGGCLAANVHGKNNWKVGPIGEHVAEIDVVTGSGASLTVRPSDSDLFHAVIGGYGLLGVITRIVMRMNRSSGNLHVEQYAAPRLANVIELLDQWTEPAEAMVGWIDGAATGEHFGRGLVQLVTAVTPESDARKTSLRRRVRVPEVVRRNLWPALRPLTTSPALRLINASQYLRGTVSSGRVRVRAVEAFEFFHDAVPTWNRAFRPGLIQYQIFLPVSAAEDAFSTILARSREVSPPILAVIKRHRADDFLLSPCLDGFSLSLDFHATKSNGARLLRELSNLTDDVVIPAGGRFYPAKDSLLTGDQFAASVGSQRLHRFRECKERVDPRGVFQSDLGRRLRLSAP